ncbi:MAG: GNAT family N-acetyltransferase [Gemmataceae bacterium]
MVEYRCFRNTDPPALVRVWNESLSGRGAIQLPSPSAFELQIFSKPYFDPEGLIVAEEGDELVGFAHAGFGTDKTGSRLAYEDGVVCILAVNPSYRRQGIASELLRRCEAYLTERGSVHIYAGPCFPRNPFYLGLYGGLELPGFLESDPATKPFFLSHGYEVQTSVLVMQRDIQHVLRIVDPRFMNFRQHFEIQAGPIRARPTWWENCVLGMLEPMEFLLVEKNTSEVVAETLLMELEGFSCHWQRASVGFYGLNVLPEFRQTGMGKFFFAQMLRYVQEQCFELAEVQVATTNEHALRLSQSLGFQEVDVGHVYRKKE